MPTAWSPSSWRRFPAAQMPAYPDPQALAEVERVLATADPVARPADSARLRLATARAAAGEALLLQGGDCAEVFTDAVEPRVRSLRMLLGEIAERIGAAAGIPVVEVARIAGQFAKPRTVAAEPLPAYRGDMINDAAADPLARTPDPARMLRAHRQSLATARLLGPVFASHEALLLPYEEALVREWDAAMWDTSGHMLWIGERTRQLDGAHVEFARGVENVVGVKCGPTLGADELLRLTERLEPRNRPGRLVLIPRLGAGRIAASLPPLMRAARSAGLGALWISDPMHGNASLVAGRKVRRLEDILSELAQFVAIARAEGVHPGGVHLELTADDVTECLGGAGPQELAGLDRNYATACDPRLNRGQALDVARAFAAMLAPALADAGAA